MSAQTIYIVTSGDYSDYHIITVFTDEALAEQFVSEYNADRSHRDASIEEYIANKLSRQLQGDVRTFSLWMAHDGTMDFGIDWEYEEDLMPRFRHTLDQSRYSREEHKGGSMRCVVVARDREHAVKIANERRVQMIASGEWPE